MNLTDLMREHRDEILAIAAKRGATNVRVFGSVARGEAGPDSDLDLLVDMLPVRSSWFPAGLIIDIEALLGRKVDVVTADGLYWYIKDRVLREAVLL